MVFAEICLTIWYIPAGLKFFAFYAGGLSGMASPILVRVKGNSSRLSDDETPFRGRFPENRIDPRVLLISESYSL
jgi:hypothetical protein